MNLNLILSHLVVGELSIFIIIGLVALGTWIAERIIAYREATQ